MTVSGSWGNLGNLGKRIKHRDTHMCTLGINCLNIYSGATSVFSYLPSLSLSLSIFLFFFLNRKLNSNWHSIHSKRVSVNAFTGRISKFLLKTFFLIKGIVCGGRFCKWIFTLFIVRWRWLVITGKGKEFQAGTKLPLNRVRKWF